MEKKKIIRYKLFHCDIIGRSISALVPATLLLKYDFVQSSKPDYVFYSVTDRPEIYSNYPNAIKIFISGEPVSPAFTFFDYCIGMDEISFGDRYYYYPDFIRTCLSNNLTIEKNIANLDEFIKNKTGFMDYVQSHERPDGLRKQLVNKFASYKPVDCPGPHLHNCEEDVSTYSNKIAFQSKHKFSLVVEASDHPHFVTEKIIHALIAGSVPVYYGTKNVTSILNPKCFIRIDPDNADLAVEEVKRLDSDMAAYRSMLSEPFFNDPAFVDKCIKGYEEFLDHIFSQPKEKAFRRERWNYEERIRKSLKRATLILPTKDRLSALKNRFKTK